MKGLKRKNRLVTTGTSGIGQAIAIQLATERVNVALNYRNNPEKLKDTEELIPRMWECFRGCDGKELPVEVNIFQEKDIIRMCQEVIKY